MRRQRQGALLCDCAPAVRVAVHPHGAGVGEAGDSCSSRGLEENLGPANVDLLRSHWIGDDSVHVGDGCEVQHRIATADRRANRIRIEDIPQGRVDIAVPVVGRSDPIEDPRLVAVGPQSVHDVRADKAGSSRYEHPHLAATCSAAAAGR